MYGELHERIKELRQQTKMSQVELAKKLNVTKQCVSNWENDNVQPSVEMLVRIADLFGVSTDYLLGRAEASVIGTEGLTEEQRSHLRLLVADLTQANGTK